VVFLEIEVKHGGVPIPGQLMMEMEWETNGKIYGKWGFDYL